MNPNIGYIIEKMRGDSLTPLGTGKREVPYPDMGSVVASLKSNRDIPDIDFAYLYSNNYTFLKGRWVMRVNSQRFYGMGYYYASSIARGLPLYLFPRREIADEIVEVRLGNKPTNYSPTAFVHSISVCRRKDTKSKLMEIASLMNKVFGIDTFYQDYVDYV